jgi:Transcriptional regulator
MIEIKHLKTLQALRNSGSLAAAAATLHQTQSALSHQFSDLEQRLGFRLFVRKSQPLRFTPQGEILLQLASQVLPQISRALQPVTSHSKPHCASLLNVIAVFNG